MLIISSGCQEKLPTLPYDQPLTDFDTLVVPASLIETRNLIVPGKLGSQSYLYVGQNDWVTAYSLLRFSNLSLLPDTLDTLLSCTLNLYTATSLATDTNQALNPTIKIGLLQSNTASNWEEDSVSDKNFDLTSYRITPLTEFDFQISDTVQLDITNFAKAMINDWLDTSKTNYGLILQAANQTETAIGCIYTRSTVYAPTLIVQYIYQGDTLTRTIAAASDVAILKYNSAKINNQRLVLSAGLTGYAFLKVNLDQLNIDKNWVVGDANLYLYIDSSLSMSYNKSITVYLNMLDSTAWNASDFTTPSTYEASHTLTAGRQILKMNLPRTIQNITSGYSKNFGFVIWLEPSSYNPILYSLYTTADSARQPYLKLFLMKER